MGCPRQAFGDNTGMAPVKFGSVNVRWQFCGPQGQVVRYSIADDFYI